ncbi:hypothetical protein [Metapseudomonas otitidis]|uniref:hypothetical protein n=1 Tax=Metapseudomonas otitidis TaxID=319939 RepID=UPI001F3C9593|nr:hypothetical protein [Pseudomonas otitidis]
MKLPTATLGLALLALTMLSATDEPKAPTQNDAIDSASKAITDFVIEPMIQELSNRMKRSFVENKGVKTPVAKDYLKQRKIEEQLAYSEEMKRKHATIVEAKRYEVDCKSPPNLRVLEA